MPCTCLMEFLWQGINYRMNERITPWYDRPIVNTMKELEALTRTWVSWRIISQSQHLTISQHGHFDLLPFVEYSSNCQDAVNNKTYRGQMAVTVSGRTCQAWTSQSPHPHTKTQIETFPDASLADRQNFCRNPDNEPGVWCYTTDAAVRFELCDVPVCSRKLFYFKSQLLV